MRLIRFQDLPVTPWRNGGGVTREVAALHDAGAGSDFLWRLSIATVSADGPFSTFTGIDRTIAVLAGRGMELQLPDRTVSLSTRSEPFTFAGEQPVHARLLQGETTDLNAMTQRGTFTQAMHRLQLDSRHTITGVAVATALVFGGEMVVEAAGTVFEAGRFDTLLSFVPGENITVMPKPGAAVHLIEFFRP